MWKNEKNQPVVCSSSGLFKLSTYRLIFFPPQPKAELAAGGENASYVPGPGETHASPSFPGATCIRTPWGACDRAGCRLSFPETLSLQVLEQGQCSPNTGTCHLGGYLPRSGTLNQAPLRVPQPLEIRYQLL